MVFADYWLEISQRGRRLGGGFLVTSQFALTALHCLRGSFPGDDAVELSFAAGEVVPGRVRQCVPEADLALIDVLKTPAGPVMVPNADRSGPGDTWHAPYRPSITDPYLSGDVLHGSVTYRCEGGGTIEALQLGCMERLGDYSGYSGGPVERDTAAGEPALLGILLEQYPDRQSPDRSSDVLFAATVAEALRRFDCFDVAHLLKVLLPTPGDAGRSPLPVRGILKASAAAEAAGGPGRSLRAPADALESRLTTADSLLDALHEWGARGVLDATQVSMLKLRVAKSVIDSALGDDV
jgi:hypothetical protein